MTNQSFNSWWNTFWTSPLQPECVNIMFHEIAHNAWNAASVNCNRSFNSWWNTFWTSPMQPECVNDMFLNIAQQAWNASRGVK